MTADVVVSVSMPLSYIPRNLEKQPRKDLVGEKVWKGAGFAPMDERDPESNEAVAERLRLLRILVSGDSQTAFARLVGLDVKRWNNFERGLPLSKDAAFKIVRAFPNFTLDWVYRGKIEGLPVRLQREIEEAGKGKTSPPTARSKAV